MSKLEDQLIQRLMDYAGETGKNEDAVETLDRLLKELKDYRANDPIISIYDLGDQFAISADENISNKDLIQVFQDSIRAIMKPNSRRYDN